MVEGAEGGVGLRVAILLLLRPLQTDQDGGAGVVQLLGAGVSALAAVEQGLEVKFLAECQHAVDLAAEVARQQEGQIGLDRRFERLQRPVVGGPLATARRRGVECLGGAVLATIQEDLPEVGDHAHQRSGIRAEAAGFEGDLLCHWRGHDPLLGLGLTEADERRLTGEDALGRSRQGGGETGLAPFLDPAVLGLLVGRAGPGGGLGAILRAANGRAGRSPASATTTTAAARVALFVFLL